MLSFVAALRGRAVSGTLGDLIVSAIDTLRRPNPKLAVERKAGCSDVGVAPSEIDGRLFRVARLSARPNVAPPKLLRLFRFQPAGKLLKKSSIKVFTGRRLVAASGLLVPTCLRQPSPNNPFDRSGPK